MNSKQTDATVKEKKAMPEDWSLSQMVGGRTKPAKPAGEEIELEAEFQKAVEKEIAGVSVDTDETIRQDETNDTKDSLQTEAAESVLSTEAKEPSIPMVTPKRTTSKQRKESLEDYRQTFLSVPKLEDRKPVFISREVRDRIDEIVHRLGGRGRSVSGFIENLARHHLDIYNDDVEMWKKL